MFVGLAVLDWGHLKSEVNTTAVVITDLLADGLDQLSGMIEASDIAQFQLEVRVEGLLVTVLPWR